MPRQLRLLALLTPVIVLTAAFARAPAAAPGGGVTSVPPATAAPSTSATAAASAARATPAPAPSGSASAAADTSPAVAGGAALPIEEYSLYNGLRVILAPDDALPNVAVHVRYDVGSADEPEGLSGIAHLVEHLMFERSAHVPHGELMRTLSNAGATALNGQTSFDATIYYETVPPEQLELALWLESDRMGYFLAALDAAALEQERAVVINEMRTRYYDAPAGKMHMFVHDATFPAWHPYHHTPIGIYEELEKMSLADIRAFSTTWYGPDNATLILAGRFAREQAVTLVERYFATLPSRPPPKRPALPPLTRRGPTRLAVRANNNRELAILSWVTPPDGTPGDHALDWIAELLAGDESSPLHERLVAKGLADDVDVVQRSMRRASVFTVRVRAAEDRSAEDLVKIVDEEIARLAASGPPPGKMKRIAARWRMAHLFDLESATRRARILSAAAGRGPLAKPFDWLDRKRLAVTADEVRAAAKALLAPEARAGVVLSRPKRTAPRWGVVIDRDEP